MLQVDQKTQNLVCKVREIFMKYGIRSVPMDDILEIMFENHIRGISNEKGIRYFKEKQKTFKYIR